MGMTLSDVLQGLYKDLGQLNAGKATGGSTSTIIDSGLINKSKDNVWRDGAIFLIHDAGGAGAAPEGQFSRISAYANPTGTFTLADAMTVAAASGDVYGYTSEYYPLNQMIQSVNDGLRALGDLDLVDTTTLSGLANTTEYASQLVWKRKKPRRIDVAGRLGFTATDNQWQELMGWQWVPAAPGSTGKIIFPDYLPVSRPMRIWYRDQHPDVYLYNDPIAEVIDPDIAIAAAVIAAATWQNNRLSGADPFLLQRQTAAEQKLNNAQAANKQDAVKLSPNLLIIGRNSEPADGALWPLPAP